MACGGGRELAEYLQSPVCQEELKQPKVLDCKHEWQKKMKLECPVCKKEQRIAGQLGVEQLPEPLIISQIQEKIPAFLVANTTEHVNRTCDPCDGKKQAIGMCQTCVKNMCKDCCEKHKSGKFTKTHTVIELSDRIVCHKHVKELITLYCQDCTKGMCMICVEDGHESHNVVDIDDTKLVHQKSKALKVFKGTVIQSSKEINQHFAEVNSLPLVLDNIYYSAMRSVQTVKETFLQALAQVQDELHQKLTAEKKQLCIYSGDIEVVKSAHDSLLTYIENLQVGQSAADIVQSADDLPPLPTDTATVKDRQNVKLPRVIESFKAIKLAKEVVQCESVNVTSLTSNIVHEGTVVNSQSPGGPLPHLSAVTKVWDENLGITIWDLLYDAKRDLIYVLADYKVKGPLCEFYPCGVFRGSVGDDREMSDYALNRLCVDTKRNFICGFDRNICCFDWSGKAERELVVSNIPQECSRELEQALELDYFEDGDMYIVMGSYLVFVSAENGHVVSQVKIRDKRRNASGFPDDFPPDLFMCHKKAGPGQCEVFVNDSDNGGIRVYSSNGVLLKRFVCEKLKNPRHMSVDPRGNLIVCDTGNSRVVRFSWEARGGDPHMEVLLTPNQLDGRPPEFVVFVPDCHLVVGTTSMDSNGVVCDMDEGHIMSFTYYPVSYQ